MTKKDNNKAPKDFTNDPVWQKRIKNILALEPAARVDANISIAKDKWHSYFSSWLGLDPEYFRHITKGRKPVSNKTLSKIEKKQELPQGSLDADDSDNIFFSKLFFRCYEFVREYITNNKINITVKQETQLIKNVYEKCLKDASFLSEQTLQHYLELLS